ncbi:MAG: phosphotransferase family protein [Acidimicrobiia bacterium]|nr:phosphotransferase family protein [Acidimicrobiia bacterium]
MDGIDESKVTEWLVENTPPVEAPVTFELIAGGRSNLTFLVTDATGRKLVLRRPPVSHVLASAHDMGREHKIIAALKDSPVPVPVALGFCEDVEVNGAPFYVMGFVEGHIVRGREQAEELFDEETRRGAGNDLVDVMVALHSLDPDAVGLGDLGKKEDYLGRQLKRWHGQFQGSQDQEREAGVFRPAEIVDEVHDLLVARKPEQQGAVIAHGDYRLDNCMFGDDGKVAAVLDWELCTLGDPLADIGTMLIYWTDRGEVPRMGIAPATTADGFPTRADLAARYAEKSSLDLSSLPYYMAFGHWRLACIMEGVFVRYATGAMGGGDEGKAAAVGMGGEVVRRAQLAKDLLASL